MNGKFHFQIQSWYPHMKPADVHLWEKFVRANGGFFDSCDYDYCIGESPDWMDEENDLEAAKQKKLYQKKIDVLGFMGDLVFITEIKPSAGSSALGQLMAYKMLFRKQHPEIKNIRLMIITNKCQNGYAEILRRHGILVMEVGLCSDCATLR